MNVRVSSLMFYRKVVKCTACKIAGEQNERHQKTHLERSGNAKTRVQTNQWDRGCCVPTRAKRIRTTDGINASGTSFDSDLDNDVLTRRFEFGLHKPFAALCRFQNV